ncbi:MAG: DNA primase [Cyclobacteriaceae bacterium]|nr:DNA primase [Cyclobacteriaceae bacterium]
MISRETIDEIKNRLDLVDVISDFVSLKRAGQNYKALSPFSNEKTPSFFVVPAKGLFKDFSSGKAGDAITFVMEHEGMSYVEALKYLAKKYGVEIKEDQRTGAPGEDHSERDSLYILMNYAKDYYHQILLGNEEGQSIGLSYFKERGFTPKTIEKFELGYALDSWDAFSGEAVRKGYNQELLEKTGLVVKKEEGRSYDRFRGRVIFPVHNISGKVIAFGARMMGKDKNQPKYINSPETEIYHKSQVLYGLYQAKNTIRQQENCYLVEGYTDVISMHQSDVENVVASSGTALTEDQIKLIRRFTENVTVLFDGDAAGIKAALRGIDLILKGGLNVRVVLLPDGEDPDSYSRKVGTTQFQEYLSSHRQDFISFKAGLYAREAAGDPIRKAESIREIVTSIALIPDPIKRSVYIQETSNQLKVAESVLFTELNKLIIQERRKRDRDQPPVPEEPITVEQIEDKLAPNKFDPEVLVQRQEREAIRLLLNYADQAIAHEEDSAITEKLSAFVLHELEDVEFSNPVYHNIAAQFKEAVLKGESLSSQHFLEQGADPAVRNIVSELITPRYATSEYWHKKYGIYFPGEADILKEMAFTNVLRLKFRVVQRMMEDNLLKIKDAEGKNDQDQLTALLDSHVGLKAAEHELASVLGIVVAR